MKKTIATLALLAFFSVSALADGQSGSTLADDGQSGSTKSCPAQQTCLYDDGQSGSTKKAQSNTSENSFGIMIESFVKAFLAQL